MPHSRRRWTAPVALLAGFLLATAPALAASPSISSATQGETVTFSTDPVANMTALTAPQTSGGGTLIFSNDPEYVTGPGILYRDNVQGAFRVFAYHVNAAKRNLYLGVVLTNPGKQAVTVDLSRLGVGGPSTDFTAVGKAGVHQWFLPLAARTLSIRGHSSAFLAASVDDTAVAPGQAINLIADATTSGPLQVAVVAQTQPTTNLHKLSVLPNTYTSPSGTPMRGTFSQSAASSLYTADASGAGQYALHVDGSGDFLQGYSAVDGNTPTVDYGNYGVLYHDAFAVTPSAATTASDFALLLNPRGGSFATAGRVNAGLTPAGLVSIPADQESVSSVNQGVVLGDYGLTAGVTTTATVEWMPAAASNLPVDILVYPY